MFKKLLLAVVVIVRLLTIFATPAHAAEQTDLATVREIVEPSVVYVGLTYTAWVKDEYFGGYLNGGEAFTIEGSCSGFVVNPDGYVMTAAHCVEADQDLRAAFIQAAADWAFETDYYDGDEGETRNQVRQWAAQDYVVEDADYNEGQIDVDVTVYRATEDGGVTEWSSHAARVLEVLPWGEGDTALLKVEADGWPALELAPESGLGVGSAVITVGYAGSVESATDISASPSYKDGTVSGTRTIGNGLVPVFEVSAALTGGMSGGPAVDGEGRVIGLNSFGIAGEPQAFNFLTPVSMIQEAMDARNVENVIDDAGTAYRQAIAAIEAGDKDAALAGLDVAEDAWGSLQVIDDLRDQANALETTVADTEVTTDTVADDEVVAAEAPVERGAVAAPTSGGSDRDGDFGGILRMVAAAAGLAVITGAVLRRRDTGRSKAPASAVEVAPVGGSPESKGRLGQLMSLHNAGLLTDDQLAAARSRLETVAS